MKLLDYIFSIVCNIQKPHLVEVVIGQELEDDTFVRT